MKFLLVLYKYFPYGGLQKDTLRFAQEGRRRGHQMTIACTSWEGERFEGVDVVLLPAHGLSNHARMEAFAKEVREYRRCHDFDAVLTMNRIPGGDFYFVADSCMGKWLTQRHSKLALSLLPRYRTYLRHEALLCSSHAHTSLFYIAEKQRNEYQEWYDLPNSRFVWLPPGMDERCTLPHDATERQARRHELGLDDETAALFLVGTNLLRKGVDRVLAAVGNLPANVKVRFFLAGNDSPRKDSMLVRRMDVSPERFTFLGARSDVPSLMQAMDLMVHPAREEGTGTVLVEAIASGLPVICTQVCGFENYVRAATGTVVPEPYRQESLNGMLTKCLEQLPELRCRTCEYARTQDFTGRSRVAIDRMEEFAKARSALDWSRLCPRLTNPPGLPMPTELTLRREEQGVEWVCVPWLPPSVLPELLEEHRNLCQKDEIWQKSPTVATTCVNCRGRTFLVREYRRDGHWRLFSHAWRAWKILTGLAGVAVPCLALGEDRKGAVRYLVCASVGSVDFVGAVRQDREDLPEILFSAGVALAILHGLAYVLDDKGIANFIVNDSFPQPIPRVLLADCVGVSRLCRPPTKTRRAEDLARFFVSVEALPVPRQAKLTEEFVRGYRLAAGLRSNGCQTLIECAMELGQHIHKRTTVDK